jgi:hypothetical protein
MEYATIRSSTLLFDSGNKLTGNSFLSEGSVRKC